VAIRTLNLRSAPNGLPDPPSRERDVPEGSTCWTRLRLHPGRRQLSHLGPSPGPSRPDGPPAGVPIHAGSPGSSLACSMTTSNARSRWACWNPMQPRRKATRRAIDGLSVERANHRPGSSSPRVGPSSGTVRARSGVSAGLAAAEVTVQRRFGVSFPGCPLSGSAGAHPCLDPRRELGPESAPPTGFVNNLVEATHRYRGRVFP